MLLQMPKPFLKAVSESEFEIPCSRCGHFCCNALERPEYFPGIVVERTDGSRNPLLRPYWKIISFRSRIRQGPIEGVVVSSGVCGVAVLRDARIELVSLLAQLRRLRERVRRAEARRSGERRRSLSSPRARRP